MSLSSRVYTATMPDWMTVEEAAELLEYHPNYVRKLLREGKLAGRKHGVVWLVSGNDVLDLQSTLESQRDAGYSKNDPRRGR